MIGYRRIRNSRPNRRPWWTRLVCCSGGTQDTGDEGNPTISVVPAAADNSAASVESVSTVSVSIHRWEGDRRYAEIRPSQEGQMEMQLQLLSELLENTKTIIKEMDRLSSTEGYLVMRPSPPPWVPTLPPRPQTVYTEWLLERLLYADFWL